MRKSLAVKSNQNSLDRPRLLNDMERIIIDCVGLAIVDKEDNTVHYVHHSAEQRLFEPQCSHSAEFMAPDLDKPSWLPVHDLS